MVIAYRKALTELGSKYRVRNAVSEEVLHLIGRGMCSTSRDENALAVISKRYPAGILTRQTALYVHGLVTAPPDRSNLAAKRKVTKIRNAAVRQRFLPGGVARCRDVDRLGRRDRAPRLQLRAHVHRAHVLAQQAALQSLEGGRRLVPQAVGTAGHIQVVRGYAEAIPRGESRLERAMGEVDEPERDEGSLRTRGKLLPTQRDCACLPGRDPLESGGVEHARPGDGQERGPDVRAVEEQPPRNPGHRPQLRTASDDRWLYPFLCIRLLESRRRRYNPHRRRKEKLSQQDYKGRRVNL